MRRILLTFLLLASTPAMAVEYYVSTVGSDSVCNGTADAAPGPGVTPNCAFRTLQKAIEEAQVGGVCGDTIYVRDSVSNTRTTYYTKTSFVFTDTCTSGTPFQIVGDDMLTTWWVNGGTPVDTGTCINSGTNSIRCDEPVDWTTTLADNVQYCVVQEGVSNIEFRDDNGTAGLMDGLLCLTWDTTGTASVDTNDGTIYYDDVNGYFYINPWNDRDGAGQEWSAFYAPIATRSYAAGVDGPFYCNGCDYFTVKDFTMLGMNNLGAIAFSSTSTNITLQNMDFWVNSAQVDDGSQDFTGTNLSFKNGYRRQANSYTSTAWGAAPSYSFKFSAHGFTLTDIYSYGAREGVSLDNANNGTINGIKSHGHHNHIFKFQDNSHDIVINDCESYQGQETVFIACAYNLEFNHCTLPYADVVIQEHPSVTCSPAVSNIDFNNSTICGIDYFDNYGPTWTNGGHDLRNNVFIQRLDGPSCNRTSNRVLQLETVGIDDGDINTSNQAGCSSCIMENNVVSTVATLWTNFCSGRDYTACVEDHTLNGVATAAENIANPLYTDAEDILGISRGNPADAGAYESNNNPACNDGIDNDGDGFTDFPADSGCVDAADNNESECGDGYLDPNESCDPGPPPQLGGETCTSQGSSGTGLSCTLSCTFDVSTCTGGGEPLVETLFRNLSFSGAISVR